MPLSVFEVRTGIKEIMSHTDMDFSMNQGDMEDESSFLA